MPYTRTMNLWDRIWKDKRGRVVIWQTPNMWLIGWAALTVISLLFSGQSRAATIFAVTGSIALIIWSVLEILKGVNYFRRALGLVVLILSVLSIIKNF